MPEAGLIIDTAGHLYGTTAAGGNGACTTFGLGCGVVFELFPLTGGGWGERVLYNFQGPPQDGAYPAASLTFGKGNNLYGTTFLGGIGDCETGCGTAFEVARKPAPR
jgi:hypothetical protein